MSFKDIMQEDVRNIFINNEEFSDIHLINGKEMSVMIDENENIERQIKSSNADGFYRKQKLIYVKSIEFGAIPAIGSQILLDNKKYFVVNATDEAGIYSITLEANVGNSRSR